MFESSHVLTVMVLEHFVRWCWACRFRGPLSSVSHLTPAMLRADECCNLVAHLHHNNPTSSTFSLAVQQLVSLWSTSSLWLCRWRLVLFLQHLQRGWLAWEEEGLFSAHAMCIRALSPAAVVSHRPHARLFFWRRRSNEPRNNRWQGFRCPAHPDIAYGRSGSERPGRHRASRAFWTVHAPGPHRVGTFGALAQRRRLHLRLVRLGRRETRAGLWSAQCSGPRHLLPVRVRIHQLARIRPANRWSAFVHACHLPWLLQPAICQPAL